MAKKGIYRPESLSEIKNDYKKYFKEDSNGYAPKYIIDENFKKKIKFIEEDITKGMQHP